MSFLVVEMIFVNRGFAAIHSVTATGSYEIGEEDSISIAKQKALDEAKRNAAEQVGIYVESETVVEDNNSSLQLLSRLLIAPSQCLQNLEQCA